MTIYLQFLWTIQYGPCTVGSVNLSTKTVYLCLDFFFKCHIFWWPSTTSWRCLTCNLGFYRNLSFLWKIVSLSKKSFKMSVFEKMLYLCRNYKNEPLEVDPYWWKRICDFLWWPSVRLKMNLEDLKRGFKSDKNYKKLQKSHRDFLILSKWKMHV